MRVHLLTTDGLVFAGEQVGIEFAEVVMLENVTVHGLPAFVASGEPLLRMPDCAIYLRNVVARW
jgi:hypothetical protein